VFLLVLNFARRTRCRAVDEGGFRRFLRERWGGAARCCPNPERSRVYAVTAAAILWEVELATLKVSTCGGPSATAARILATSG
jgi:hypothetical protein